MTENNPNYETWQNVTSNWNFQPVENEEAIKDRIQMLEEELKDLKRQLKSKR